MRNGRLRKLAVLAVLLTFAAAIVSACGSDDGDGGQAATAGDTTADTGGSPFDGKRLGFVTFGNASVYQVAQGEWFKRFAEEQGASVSVLDGNFDPAVQQRAVDDLVASGVDGIVWQQADSTAAVPSMRAAHSAGIPVLVVGGTPDESVPAPSVVFNDSELAKAAGENAARWLQENQPDEKAKLVMFDIPALELCRVWRMDAFQEGVTEVMGEDNVEVVFRDLVEHDRSVTRAKMEDLLQAGRDFNMFTACGADGAVGGMQALVDAGRGRAVDNVPETEYVFSIDATPSELEYLFNPSRALVETVGLTPKANAEKYIDVLGEMLAGELPIDDPRVVDAPGAVIPLDCEEAAQLIDEEYGVADDHEPIDCGTFGS